MMCNDVPGKSIRRDRSQSRDDETQCHRGTYSAHVENGDGPVSGGDQESDEAAETHETKSTATHESISMGGRSDGRQVQDTTMTQSLDEETHATVKMTISSGSGSEPESNSELVKTTGRKEPHAPLLSRLAEMAEAESDAIRRKSGQAEGLVNSLQVTPSSSSSTLAASDNERAGNVSTQEQSLALSCFQIKQ